MREKVKKIRGNINQYVDNKTGYYFWWFRESCVKQLLKVLPDIDYDSLRVDKSGYAALHFGISRDINQRAKWDIDPSVHHKNSKGDYCNEVSALRHTLSALLEIDVSKSEQAINDFIEQNCELEWYYTDSREEAEEVEAKELSTNYYPLSIRDNKVVSETTLVAIKKLREQYKR